MLENNKTTKETLLIFVSDLSELVQTILKTAPQQ